MTTRRRLRLLTASQTAGQYSAASTTEAHVLGLLDDYATRFGGFTRHIRNGAGQNVAGIPDVLMWVPALSHDRDEGRDHGHVLFGALELKIGADTMSAAQWRVMEATHQIDRIVAEVVRIGAPPRAGEMSLDEVLQRLDEARGWT